MPDPYLEVNLPYPFFSCIHSDVDESLHSLVHIPYFYVPISCSSLNVMWSRSPCKQQMESPYELCYETLMKTAFSVGSRESMDHGSVDHGSVDHGSVDHGY